MAIKDKVGKKGDTVKYIARTQAVRKLQITLAQFRRLCILKGIYPVEPKNKRKVAKGSTALKTFYHRKDIQWLLHEPILEVLRAEKIHSRKLGAALGRREWDLAKQLRDDKPVYSLHHVVKERYPSFVDALADLDDALSLIFLFATLPVDERIEVKHTAECARLAAEWQHYVIAAACLVRTFVSIKGIYYQAEIRGQTITWIVPHQFAQNVPTDVDFKVMATFLEIYETLLAFVNFKLYADLGLVYPPKVDRVRDEAGGGLCAYVLESQNDSNNLAADVITSIESQSQIAKKNYSKMSEQEVEALGVKILQIANADLTENVEDERNEDESEDIPEPIVAPSTEQEVVTTLKPAKELKKTLFGKCVFWLSREVPRYSLEFVIKSFGGQVGWDSSSGAGSPFFKDDHRITHHITDRPVVPSAGDGTTTSSCEKLQPQWIYDSCNANLLVKTKGYHPGDELPPHLSPFVTPGEDDYVPQEAMDGEIKEQEIMVPIEQSEESAHQAELSAEAAGVPFSEYAVPLVAKKIDALPKQQEEEKELAKMMMSKRDKKLFERIQFGKKKKLAEAQNLRSKKKAISK